jgi:hypothetical protein
VIDLIVMVADGEPLYVEHPIPGRIRLGFGESCDVLLSEEQALQLVGKILAAGLETETP